MFFHSIISARHYLITMAWSNAISFVIERQWHVVCCSVFRFFSFSVFWRIFHFPLAHCHLSSQGLSVFGSKENSECLWKYLSPENVKVNVCGVKELGSWGEFSTACGGFPPHRSLSPCPISHIPVVLSLSAQSLKLSNGQSESPDSPELTRQSPNQVIV